MEKCVLRHGPARENNGARGVDNVLEVRRGIQVLVLDLNLAVRHTESDTAVCSIDR